MNNHLRLMREAFLKAYPIIYDEAKRLGIDPPDTEWVKDVTVAKKRVGAVYNYDTQTIYFSTDLVKEMVGMKLSRKGIIRAIVMTYFHEFKHYIDHKVHRVSLDDFIANKEKYERGTREYAEKMLRLVG